MDNDGDMAEGAEHDSGNKGQCTRIIRSAKCPFM